MAREITIFADTVNGQISISDIDTLGNNSRTLGGGFGQWFYEIVGNITDLANQSCSVKFWMNGQSIGACVFADIVACDVNGLDLKAQAINSQLYMADIVAGMGGVFFQLPPDSVANEINDTLASIANVNLLNIQSATAGLVNTTNLDNGPDSFTTDPVLVAGSNTITVQYAFSDTDTGDTNAIKMQGTVDGVNWFDIGSGITGAADSTGTIIHRVQLAGVAVANARVVVEVTGSGTKTTMTTVTLISIR